jgi:hypothetical protein
MPTGTELSVFEKHSRIFHSARRTLDVTREEKSEEVFTAKKKPYSLVMYYEFKPTTVKNKNWLHEILES